MQALRNTLKKTLLQDFRFFMSYSKSACHTGSYVVVDCDVGTDDAWALLTIIKCEKFFPKTMQLNSNGEKKELLPYKILGITCVQGNSDVHNCVKNTFRVLDSVDRLDIPVYQGCENPIVPRSWTRKLFYHGKDGFGDVPNLPIVSNAKIQPVPAVVQMYDFVCKYPKMVDFLMIGPLTNLATCITVYGKDFLDKVRSVWIMGGNVEAKGNNDATAEFNFHMDPEAAYIVLNSLKSSPIILPWETCIDTKLTPDIDWRFNVLGKVDTKAMKLMNTVEKAVILPKKFKTWVVCDAGLVAAYCFPHLVVEKCSSLYCTVELTGSFTRAQMVLDRLNPREPNTCVVMKGHPESYKNVLSWVGGLIDDKKFMNAMKLCE